MTPSAVLWMFLTAVAAATAPAEAPPLEIRFGVLSYEDFHRDLAHYDRLFADLARTSSRPLRLRAASGTYGDLVQWLDRGQIDVAMVTPGVLAARLASRGDRPQPAYQYLGTLLMPPAQSALAAEDRRRPGQHDAYRSVCVVRADSDLRSVEDLRRRAAERGVTWLFVDPLSVSGRIAPEYALMRHGIRPAAEEVTFTWSHSNSLRCLLSAEPRREEVAFVWDDALAEVAEAAGRVRRLPLPELDALQIPGDAVVARTGFEHVELIGSLLAAQRVNEFRRLPDWAARYGAVSRWQAALGLPQECPSAERVSLDDLGAILLHYARSQPRPPRLALVLSGGGAKCSYQVGAVAALEEELAGLRGQHGDPGLDIGLVVGTSGGAINALPVALGIPTSEAGRTDFRQTWMQLDQRDIVRPPYLVRTNMGLWFAVIQIAIVLRLLGRRVGGDPRKASWPAQALVLLGALEIAVGYVPWTPWRMLGTSHVVHHAWLWCTFGVRWSAWCLLLVGLASIVVRRLAPRWRQRLTPPWPWVAAGLWFGLLGLPLAQIVTVLFIEATLSQGTGIERALAEQFPRLIDGHLTRAQLPPLDLDPSLDDRQRLKTVSEQIFQRRLLARDLVLTGSCLAHSSPELPDDLYFFAAADTARPRPPLRARGVDLAARPEVLLDVIMGSGSIYPVFPPRKIEDFPRPGEEVDLVDGGFAHNSPIEAAVLWGATHIVLIEASPEKRMERRNFVENVAAAFSHLYSQAQRVDARSKEQVVVFTLTPQPPHLCVLDFADNLIEQSIAKGYVEARGSALPGDTPRPAFRKELGEPQFWTP